MAPTRSASSHTAGHHIQIELSEAMNWEKRIQQCKKDIAARKKKVRYRATEHVEQHDQPTSIDGDDAIDTKGVEQGEQPIPLEMEEPHVRRESKSTARKYNLIRTSNWTKAMHEKTNSLHKNNTYELVELPKSKKTLRNKWVFKLKKDDDMLIVGKYANSVGSLKNDLFKSFDMKDLGPTRQILVSTPLGGHFKLSKKSCPSLNKEKEKTPYSSAVGSLKYVMVCTRPTIAHAVGVVNKFMVNPGKEHWEAVK
uniref:Reverse transcriptase Ty1/copia-type domain-containing protein n=1 Tax=Fagus sylvatica TaxID=28930 RepID=A0A2N9HNV2_FAGSY